MLLLKETKEISIREIGMVPKGTLALFEIICILRNNFLNVAMSKSLEVNMPEC